MNRKLFSFLCALVFTLTLVCAAAADSTVVDTILTVETTQSFKDDPVSADDLKIILQAGLAAESAINQQPWYFVAVTNPEVMKELAGGSAGGAMPSGGQLPERGKPRRHLCKAGRGSLHAGGRRPADRLCGRFRGRNDRRHDP